jgi:hypothetical protein
MPEPKSLLDHVDQLEQRLRGEAELNAKREAFFTDRLQRIERVLFGEENAAGLTTDEKAFTECRPLAGADVAVQNELLAALRDIGRHHQEETAQLRKALGETTAVLSRMYPLLRDLEAIQTSAGPGSMAAEIRKATAKAVFSHVPPPAKKATQRKTPPKGGRRR